MKPTSPASQISLVDREEGCLEQSRRVSGARVAAPRVRAGLAVSGAAHNFRQALPGATLHADGSLSVSTASSNNAVRCYNKWQPAGSAPPPGHLQATFPCLRGEDEPETAGKKTPLREEKTATAVVRCGGLHDMVTPMGRSRRTHCHEHAVGQQKALEFAPTMAAPMVEAQLGARGCRCGRQLLPTAPVEHFPETPRVLHHRPPVSPVLAGWIGLLERHCVAVPPH